MLSAICPIMPSRDFDRTIAFYDGLGFELGKRYDDYLILRHGRIEVHFFHHAAHVPERSDHGAYIRLDDPVAWSNEIAALRLPSTGIPRFMPAAVKSWGMLELAVIDLDGNLLRAGTPAEKADD